MQRLDNIDVYNSNVFNSTISNSVIRGCDLYVNSIHHDKYSYVTCENDAKFTYGEYECTAAELGKKLQLLDRLIAEYLPETLV